MKKLILSSALIMLASAAMATNPNQACTQGNAAFCNVAGPAGPVGPQGPAGQNGTNGTDGGFSGIINSPEGIRPDAIGNGTPEQGVVRLRDERGDTFHVVNQNTLFKRADGGTASVNAGDRVSNAHEAELRNRQATVDAVLGQIGTPQDGADGMDGRDGTDGRDGKDGADGRDGTNGTDGRDGRDGRDFDASGHMAAVAASTAIAGLQFQSLTEGQTGWAAGIGGQFDGVAAFAVGLNHGLSDTISVNASISSDFDGKGVSAFIGASGRF